MDDLKLACSAVVKQAVRNWITENCQNTGSLHTWMPPPQKKKNPQKPSAKQIRELLEMNRIHPTQVTKIMSLEKRLFTPPWYIVPPVKDAIKTT
jgi:hypothetical protein